MVRYIRWIWDKRHDWEQHLCFLVGFTPVDRDGRSVAHFPLRQTWRFQFPHQTLSFPEYQYFIFASLLCVYLTAHMVCRGCSSYDCFILREVRLSCKLLWQGYFRESLKLSRRKWKRKISDSVLWQKPLHWQKNPKSNVKTLKRHQKLRLHNNCGPT